MGDQIVLDEYGKVQFKNDYRFKLHYKMNDHDINYK